MSQIKIVDARGLSCPLPALHTRRALGEMTEGTVEVLVDTATSRDNVMRTAERVGWQVVSVEEHPDGYFRIVMKK